MITFYFFSYRITLKNQRSIISIYFLPVFKSNAVWLDFIGCSDVVADDFLNALSGEIVHCNPHIQRAFLLYASSCASSSREISSHIVNRVSNLILVAPLRKQRNNRKVISEWLTAKSRKGHVFSMKEIFISVIYCGKSCRFFDASSSSGVASKPCCVLRWLFKWAFNRNRGTLGQ